MAADCEAWLNANPVETDDPSDSYRSGNEVAADGDRVPAPTGAVHEARLKAKAKRRLRKNSSRDSGRGDSLSENGDPSRSAAPAASPKGKVLDRRSRLGKGRGLPKKGGAGGKGVWGTPGAVYDVEEVDVRDPNYDEAQEDCVYETVVPPLDENDFARTVTPIVREYFEHGDSDEVAELLGELNLGSVCGDVPFLAVSLALEGKASQRELASFLLSRLCGGVLSRSHVEASFRKLLKELPELVLDTPTAPQVNLLLKEYVLSGDAAEAERCLRELEVPHFHHELVYEAIVTVLESKGDATVESILKLLGSLFESTVVAPDQMRRGYERAYADIAEIAVDVPRAYFLLERFVDRSFGAGVIDKNVRDLCPSRGRKRFVSEGDGGLVKPHNF